MALEDTLRELAQVFREGGADAQARKLDRLLAEGGDDLPHRVLAPYAQGMGWTYDPHLRRDGQSDPDANERRDVLAKQAYQEAQQRLGRE